MTEIQKTRQNPREPQKPAELETETCAFCRKPMSSDAIQCSSCRNWRQDIHLLIDTYRKLMLAQVVACTIGALLASLLFVAAAASATTETLFGRSFSSEKFFASPWFVLAVLLSVLVVVVWIVTVAPAVRTRHRIQQATKGLWERPWWSF